MKSRTHLPVVLLVAAGLLLTCAAFIFFIPVWTTASNIPVPVRAGNTAAYAKNNNGWLLIVSGRGQNGAIMKTFQRYDVTTNVWDTLAPHPTGLLGAATAVLKDSLYVIGGVINPPGAGLNKVSKFNIVQNQWTTVAQLPVALVDAKAVSYQDSLIYTAGGVGGPNRGNVYLYNARTNSWRTATPFNASGRRSFGGFAITGDTLIYLCGTAAFGSTIYYDSVYVGVISQSNRASITWSRGANFPGQTRSFFDAHSWGNKGIIMTGGSTDNTLTTHSTECYTYSPGNNQWIQLPGKPTSWLTGQSGSVRLANNVWKLIGAGGYANGYLSQTEILTDTLLTLGVPHHNENSVGRLAQNQPNPFQHSTTIHYQLHKPAHISLQVMNARGQNVATLVNRKQQPGSYSVKFDGQGLAGGTYYYSLLADEKTLTRKMLLLD